MRARSLRASALLATAATLLTGLLAAAPSSAQAAYKPPPVKHVFVIMLENYYATGHESNDNYISIVSGQPPNVQNQADCQIFDDFIGGVSLPDGVVAGTGCVYPAGVQNIGTQLSASGRSWKAYEQDMGNDPNRETAVCGHPAINSQDNTQDAEAGDGYATRHDPFVYFHSVIDSQSYCDAHVVALGSPTGVMPAAALAGETGLATDLKKAATTPAFSFITPNLCNDGHDYPCTNQTSGASAAADIDSFLSTWVPKITSSPAYKQGGLLEITFDEAADSDGSSCCGELPGPGSPLPGIIGPGGGRIGALLLSPYIKGGTVSTTAYNHYSSLASWEELFGLKRLAYAANVTSTFGADVFTAYK
jgi:hypothetical protein